MGSTSVPQPELDTVLRKILFRAVVEVSTVWLNVKENTLDHVVPSDGIETFLV